MDGRIDSRLYPIIRIEYEALIPFFNKHGIERLWTEYQIASAVFSGQGYLSKDSEKGDHFRLPFLKGVPDEQMFRLRAKVIAYELVFRSYAIFGEIRSWEDECRHGPLSIAQWCEIGEFSNDSMLFRFFAAFQLVKLNGAQFKNSGKFFIAVAGEVVSRWGKSHHALPKTIREGAVRVWFRPKRPFEEGIDMHIKLMAQNSNISELTIHSLITEHLRIQNKAKEM
jgi:hypothetical protein